MDNRLNQLKQYMDFYKNSGANVSVNPESNIYNDKRALDWANSQLSDQARGQQMQRQPMPNFYGDQGMGQGQFQQPQYVQPTYQQQENPFTNYLRKLMDQGGGQMNYRG